MIRETQLLIGYALFFTLCNLAVFLFYYLYGFFREKKLRLFADSAAIPEKLRFLFRFKGIKGDEKSTASRLGMILQAGSVVYLIVMEILCFAVAKLANDMILPCRIAFFVMLPVICFGAIFLITYSSKHSNR